MSPVLAPAESPQVAAMLLAAGRGERMRPLTDSTPKPLLPVHGKALMQWHLEALSRAGVRRVVVNTAWLGRHISAQFNDHFRLQPSSNRREPLLIQDHLEICYSHEGEDFGGALETAGGVARALPLLCPPTAAGALADVFWVLAGDVYVPDFVFSAAALARFVASDKLAHLWLVPNPAHHRRGDFGLDETGGIALALNLPDPDTRARYTFSSIGLYRRALFEPPWCNIASGNPLGVKAPLGPLLRAAMDNGLVSAELYGGAWTDVGTPERLRALNLNQPSTQP